MIEDELLGRGLLVCSQPAALFEPPVCGAVVEGGNVEFVDEERHVRLERVGQPP